MVNQQLLSYIRGQLTAGVSRADIIKALATGGWNEQDAKEAFDAIDGKATTAPSPSPPAAAKAPPVSTATAARTNIGIGEAARMAQGGSAQPQAEPKAAPQQQPARASSPGPQPVAPRLTIDTRPVGQPSPKMVPVAAKKGRRAPWMLILVLLLLALAAAGAYLYYPQMLNLFNSTVEMFFPTTTPSEQFPITEWEAGGDTVPTAGVSTDAGTGAITTEEGMGEGIFPPLE